MRTERLASSPMRNTADFLLHYNQINQNWSSDITGTLYFLFFRNISMTSTCRTAPNSFSCSVQDLEGWESIWRPPILSLFMTQTGTLKWIYRLWYVEYPYRMNTTVFRSNLKVLDTSNYMYMTW